MSDTSPPPTPLLLSFRRLLQLAGRHKTWLFVALFIDLVQAVIVVAQSHVLRGLFDAVIAGNESTFITGWILSLSLGLVNSPLSYLRTRSLGLFSERTLFGIRQRVAARFNLLPVGYLEERHSGDLISIVNADLAKLKNLTGSDLLSLIGQTSRAVFSLVYIIFISWQLTLVSLVMTPLMFMLLAKVSGPITKRTNEMQAEIGSLNSVAQDGLGGLPITKSFNLVKILDERFNNEELRELCFALKIDYDNLENGSKRVKTIGRICPFKDIRRFLGGHSLYFKYRENWIVDFFCPAICKDGTMDVTGISKN